MRRWMLVLTAMACAPAGGDGVVGDMAGTTTREALTQLQDAYGWGPEACTSPGGVAQGVGRGEQLDGVTLLACDGEPLPFTELCGADALWVTFSHAWCPHCRVQAESAEAIAGRFKAGRVAAVNVVVETPSRGVPNAADCAAWREGYGHGEVLTLFDPDQRSFVLWERNYTALSMTADADQVIVDKWHTDDEDDLVQQIRYALQR